MSVLRFIKYHLYQIVKKKFRLIYLYFADVNEVLSKFPVPHSIMDLNPLNNLREVKINCFN